MITEKNIDEKYKVVRFYIDELPFEIYTEIENDPITTAELRKLELKRDYEEYGDYYHSDLYVERIKPETIEE